MYRKKQSAFLFFIAVFLTFATSLQAQQPRFQGYDVLALARYCDVYLQAPRLPAVSTLMGTFGNPLPCIERRIKQGDLQLVQIDLRDATCFRNGVCPPGTPPLRDWRLLRNRASEVNKLAIKYPQIEWWVSPWLEHDERNPEMVQKACEESRAGCPTCKCINSPVSGARVPTIPLELHGTTVKAFSVSGDGKSIFDGDNIRSDGNDFEHRTSGRDQTYAWCNELNLRCTGEHKFVPPMQRTNRPTLSQFRQMFMNLQPEPPIPPAPQICKNVRRASGGEIVKPNAESYCNGEKDDGRGNKPLLILKKAGRRGDKLKLYSTKGQEVGCFSYYGTFTTPGFHRWYMGTCSKQTPTELADDLGSEWGFVDLGRGECLLTNAVRRMGTYR